MSDEEQNRLSWKQIRNGNREALFELYNNTYFHLVRFGLRITGDDELVKDCVTQLFFQLWDKHRKLNDVTQVKSYLFTTLRRMLISEIEYSLKTNTAITNFTNKAEPGELSYEEIIIRVQAEEEMKLKLRRALAQLTPKQTELIQLMFFDGMSYEEIAAKTSQSIKTAYNTIYNAISMLRKILR